MPWSTPRTLVLTATLATGGNGQTTPPPDARLLASFGGVTSTIAAHDVQPGGVHVVTAGPRGDIALWGPPDWSQPKRYRLDREPLAFALHPTDPWLFVGCARVGASKGLVAIHLETDERIHLLDESVYGVAVRDDGLVAVRVRPGGLDDRIWFLESLGAADDCVTRQVFVGSTCKRIAFDGPAGRWLRVVRERNGRDLWFDPEGSADFATDRAPGATRDQPTRVRVQVRTRWQRQSELIVEVGTDRRHLITHDGDPDALTFSADSRFLAAAGRGVTRMVDLTRRSKTDIAGATWWITGESGPEFLVLRPGSLAAFNARTRTEFGRVSLRSADEEAGPTLPYPISDLGLAESGRCVAYRWSPSIGLLLPSSGRMRTAEIDPAIGFGVDQLIWLGGTGRGLLVGRTLGAFSLGLNSTPRTNLALLERDGRVDPENSIERIGSFGTCASPSGDWILHASNTELELLDPRTLDSLGHRVHHVPGWRLVGACSDTRALLTDGRELRTVSVPELEPIAHRRIPWREELPPLEPGIKPVCALAPSRRVFAIAREAEVVVVEVPED